MRALRSCDFCASEADGTFEVIPPELNPTENQQRRLLLCTECAERLEYVLEPLLARVSVETAASGPISEGSAAEQSGNPDAEQDEHSKTEPESESISFETQHASVSSTQPKAAAETANKTVLEESTDDETDVTNQSSVTISNPHTYAKVIRLLRNRDLPMERATVETIVGGAYDLEAHEVDDLLEEAIEAGRLREEGTQLEWA